LGLALLFAISGSANAQSFGGRTSGKEKAAYIGGGAAAGALIGGLLGGKKGAVIGGLLGAGGGAGYVYYKGREDNRYNRYYGNRYDGYYGTRDYRDHRAFDNNRRFDNWSGDDRCDHDRDGWRRGFNR
jgi:hypothetical protein